MIADSTDALDSNVAPSDAEGRCKKDARPTGRRVLPSRPADGIEDTRSLIKAGLSSPPRRSKRWSIPLITALLRLFRRSKPVPYAISSDDAQRFAAGIVRMQISGRTAPVILGLKNCEVFSAVYDGDKIVGWKSVLDPKVYGYFKFMTGCRSQSLTYDGRSVRAHLQRIPLGAGGGGVGTYVSIDGEHWEPLP